MNKMMDMEAEPDKYLLIVNVRPRQRFDWVVELTGIQTSGKGHRNIAGARTTKSPKKSGGFFGLFRKG